MKYILSIMLCACYVISHAQDTFKFNVTKAVSRLKNNNGEWNDWRTLGELNSKMHQQFVINLEGKWLQWITQYEDQIPVLHIYKIVDLEDDSTYKDFGVSEIKLHAKEGDMTPQLFRILSIDSPDGTSFSLITGTDIFQSKYALKYEK